MASRAEFAAVMAFLGAAVGKEPTEQQTEVYYQLLGSLPADLLDRAAQRAVMRHGYATIPPVGEIYRQAVELSGAVGCNAAEAYDAVMRVVREWGHWLADGLPTHEPTRAALDAAVGALPRRALQAAKAYGWGALCETPPSISKPHFCQLYDGLSERDRGEALMPPGLRLHLPEVRELVGAIGRLPEAPWRAAGGE